MTISVRRLGPGAEDTASEIAALFKSATLTSTEAGRFLANPANYLFIAERGSVVAGFALAYCLDRLDGPAPQLFVYEVGVLPQHQRQGVGSALMRFVRELVNTEGLREAFVLTESSNTAARRLYARTGGKVESEASVLYVYPGEALRCASDSTI